jgi:heme-degrading monooxygenase HmoA
MITRHWRGWTSLQNAAAYEALLTQTVLPKLKTLKGYRGGYVLRRDASNEAEFIVINLFDSLDAVKEFAGPKFETAVFEPEARQLLSRAESFASHYDVRACTM